MKMNLPPIPGEASSPGERSKAERTYKEEKKLENKKKKERIMKNEKKPTFDSRRKIQGGKNLQISVLKNRV